MHDASIGVFIPHAEIDAAGDRNVVFKLRSGVELPFTGRCCF